MTSNVPKLGKSRPTGFDEGKYTMLSVAFELV